MLWTFLRSKALQIATVIGLLLMAAIKVRRDIQTNAVNEHTSQLKEADAHRAKAVRNRVDAVKPSRLQSAPARDASDNRGYRD